MTSKNNFYEMKTSELIPEHTLRELSPSLYAPRGSSNTLSSMDHLDLPITNRSETYSDPQNKYTYRHPLSYSLNNTNERVNIYEKFKYPVENQENLYNRVQPIRNSNCEKINHCRCCVTNYELTKKMKETVDNLSADMKIMQVSINNLINSMNTQNRTDFNVKKDETKTLRYDVGTDTLDMAEPVIKYSQYAQTEASYENNQKERNEPVKVHRPKQSKENGTDVNYENINVNYKRNESIKSCKPQRTKENGNVNFPSLYRKKRDDLGGRNFKNQKPQTRKRNENLSDIGEASTILSDNDDDHSSSENSTTSSVSSFDLSSDSSETDSKKSSSQHSNKASANFLRGSNVSAMSFHQRAVYKLANGETVQYSSTRKQMKPQRYLCKPTPFSQQPKYDYFKK